MADGSKKSLEQILSCFNMHQVGDTALWVGPHEDEGYALREAFDAGTMDNWSEAYCATFNRLNQLGLLRRDS